MSYRGNRERSRSRDRDNGRHRSPGRDGRGRENREVDRYRRDSRDSRDKYRKDELGRDIPISKPLAATKQSRIAQEATKQERLALVKKLTRGDDSDDENQKKKKKTDDGQDPEDDDYDQEEDMLALLGFKGFDSTKGKPIEENIVGVAAGAVSNHKARVYRQYMNRRGGFNRPLQKLD